MAANPSSLAAAESLLMADVTHLSPTAAAAGNALLAPAVAAAASKAIISASSSDVDLESGFQRPDFGKEELAGTVEFHQRHLFFCEKSAEDVIDLEGNESDRLPTLLAAAIEARKSDLKFITKLTVCEGKEGTESAPGDVLIFPDMIRFRGMTHSDVEKFVEEVLVKDFELFPGSLEAIRGSFVFVCTNGGTDKRCNVCGPALIGRFKEEMQGKGVNQVSVQACSDIGSHQYAGHIAIFSSDTTGAVTGHWYGYVSPADVPVLLEKHVLKGEVVDHLWRGQLGLSEEEQKKVFEQKQKKLQLDLNSSLEPVTQVGLETSNGAVENSSDTRFGLPQSNSMMKLKIPKDFDGDAILTGFELHHFYNAKELQNVINKTKNWLPGKLSLALLLNGKLFAVKGNTVTDKLFQKNGAVCVVEKEQLSEVVITSSLYSNSFTGTLKEHKPETTYVSDIGIIKSDFGGNEWMRRKYTIKGDDAYHLFQWRPQNSDSETRLKSKVKGKQIEEEVAVSTRDEAQTANDFSIQNCISIAKKIQELTAEEKAAAYDLFIIEVNRQIFVCADQETRLVWLRKHLAIPD